MWTNLLLAVALVALAWAYVAWWRGRSRRAHGAGYPYASRERLLSPSGRRFLPVLEEVAGPDVRVFAQVRMTDVLRVTHRPGSSRFSRALSRIAARHFDFVLCDRQSLAVLCVVALDERKRDARDESSFAQSFLAQTCRFAGLPVLRVIACHDYDTATLHQRLGEVIQRGRDAAPPTDTAVTMAHAVEFSTMPPAGNDARMDAPVRSSDAPRSSVLTPALMARLTHRSPESEAAPSCPRCGAAMLRRRVRIGERAGGEFWGCSRFPVCRAITPITTSGSRAG